MRYFEENIHDGDDIREQCQDLLSAVHAVVSNTLRVSDMDEGQEKTQCMALYTVIGLCGAMLQTFPEKARKKAFEECDEYFSGEYGRKREESINRLVSKIFGF